MYEANRLFVVWISMTLFGATASLNATETQLYNSLFSNYNNMIRPIIGDDYIKQIEVSIAFIINQVENLNERDQILISNGYMILTWMDELLTWNPDEYGGSFFIIVEASKIWLPEITPINSVVGALELKSMDKETRVRIYDHGQVLWIPALKWETSCQVDVSNFPYDIQSCEIHYANWMYTAHLVNFTALPNVDTSQLVNGQQWEVIGTEAWQEERDSGPTRIPIVKMRIRLRRDPTFFEFNILVPIMILSFLMILMFALPVESGEKVSLGITIMLAYSIFSLMIMDVTPRTGKTPQITMVILLSTVMAGVSILVNVIIINIHHHSPEKAVPNCIKTIITGKFGNLLCCMCYDKKQNDNCKTNTNAVSEELNNIDIKQSTVDEVIKYLEYFKSIKMEEVHSDNNRNDWNKLARVIDRFMLIVYLIFFVGVIVTIVLLRYDHYKKGQGV